jgi:hypothetical protein
VRFLYVHFAHEIAGAARTRSSLRPLFSYGANGLHNFGRVALRDGGFLSINVIASEAKQSIARQSKSGLLRRLRSSQ